MAYSVPVTAVSAAKLTATQWNASVRDNILFLANPPACRVYRTTDQSLTDNTETTITFDAERFDPTGMHSTSSNTGRITFSDAGVYIVSFHGWLASGGDYAEVEGRIRLNGSTVIALESRHMSTFNAPQTIMMHTIYKFAAGDYVEMRLRQDNTAAAARNLIANTPFSPEFAAVWVGLG